MLAHTIAFIKSVLALLDTARADAPYYEKGQGVLELCGVALNVLQATTQGETRETATPVRLPIRGDLGVRIAELAAHGKDVRQIARILGVPPSTVSRRLRTNTSC